MAENELRKMKRAELIEIIYALQQNEEELKKENAQLQEKLADRTVKIAEAGSIAEAVVGLNDIFQKAQDTADHYVESVRIAQAAVNEEVEKLLSDAKEKAEIIIREAEKRKRILEDETDRELESKWTVFDSKVTEVLSAHSAIRDLLEDRADEGK